MSSTAHAPNNSVQIQQQQKLNQLQQYVAYVVQMQIGPIHINRITQLFALCFLCSQRALAGSIRSLIHRLRWPHILRVAAPHHQRRHRHNTITRCTGNCCMTSVEPISHHGIAWSSIHHTGSSREAVTSISAAAQRFLGPPRRIVDRNCFNSENRRRRSLPFTTQIQLEQPSMGICINNINE